MEHEAEKFRKVPRFLYSSKQQQNFVSVDDGINGFYAEQETRPNSFRAFKNLALCRMPFVFSNADFRIMKRIPFNRAYFNSRV